MKLICPNCGAATTLAAMTQAADLLALAKAQEAFGADWPLVSEYLDLFRPASGREMAVGKRLRLAREIWQMWEPGRFQYGREIYRVGREEFREALALTINQVRPPLTGHNYLKKVLLGAAEQTSRRRERELREKEDRLRSGVRGQGSGVRGQGSGDEIKETDDLGPPEDPEWRRELSRLSTLVRHLTKGELKEIKQRELQAHLAKGRELRRAELTADRSK